MKNKKGLHCVAFILLVIGGLNWLIFGLLGKEIGYLLGGMDSTWSTIVYVLVGLAALYEIFTHKKNCKKCDSGSSASSSSSPMMS